MPDGRDIAIRELMRQLDEAQAENARYREALERARPVVEYVSRGRGFVDGDPYPDAWARRANAEIQALRPTTQEDRQ